MSVLIRLQTPVFEFSVWTNDISERAKVYHSTVLKRASLTLSAKHHVNGTAISSTNTNNHSCFSSILLFAPDIELVTKDIATITSNKCDSLEQNNALDQKIISLPEEIIADSDGPEKVAEVMLELPLFFENTQYQFEWIFFGEVTDARLVHKSQRITQAFRFAEQRGLVPARLTGTINTGNDVGWLCLPLRYELDRKVHTQHIAFEVLPTKMALHQDLPAMYRAIDAIYPLWRFSMVEKTEQNVTSSKQRGHFPLMWLANFALLRSRFEQALKIICASPHSRLQPAGTNANAARLKGSLSHSLVQQVKQDFANGRYDNRYPLEKKQLSVDTPENRFIKMAANHCKTVLAKFEEKIRKSNQAPNNQRLSDSFLDELHSWQKPLHHLLTQSFLKEVGAYTGSSRESLVLQLKTGYSTVYRVWQELKFYLDLFGSRSSISMKSIAEVYEIWCFLCLKKIFEQDLGFKLIENGPTKLVQNDFFEYQLKDGFAGAFCFKRADGVTARLAHEPKFTINGKSIRSYLVNQEPDIVLELTLPETATSGVKRKFIWLFDAKYRIKTDKNRFDEGNEDITATDYVPDDAINQMHRYRDALIRISESEYKLSSAIAQTSKKSRPVFGAFVLYPGFFDQTQTQNPYASAIEEVGIGAFALLPSQAESDYCGHQWLLDFLKAQIGTALNEQAAQRNSVIYPAAAMAEQIYLQEASRIPYYGMYQVLYPDLTMTVSLGGQRGRESVYFEAFEQGTAQWYHLPQNTFGRKFRQHIVEEIRYLGLATTSDTQSTTKQIDKLWPVKCVMVLPRYAITKAQAGKNSDSADPYYLFKLGKPLTLHTPVTKVPHRPIKNSIKLTTLTRLENVIEFDDVEIVYEEAMV